MRRREVSRAGREEKAKRGSRRRAYVGAALEQNGLVAGPAREGKGADGLGRFVVVGGKQLVEAVVADGLVEPLDVDAREAAEGVEAEARVLDEDGAAHAVGGDAALFQRHALDGALQLGQVDGLGAHDDARRLQDGLDLAQLVGVARDEVDRRLGHLEGLA